LLVQISERFLDNDATGQRTSLQRTLDLDS